MLLFSAENMSSHGLLEMLFMCYVGLCLQCDQAIIRETAPAHMTRSKLCAELAVLESLCLVDYLHQPMLNHQCTDNVQGGHEASLGGCLECGSVEFSDP